LSLRFRRVGIQPGQDTANAKIFESLPGCVGKANER
jgi:hypothetical protein